jgi:hypothetical protein
MKIKTVLLAIPLVIASPTLSAETVFNVGLRTWFNAWTSWDVYPPLVIGNATLPGASENFTSGNRAALIPTFSVRHNDLLLSASRFARKSYSFDGNSGSFGARREETDALVGYYVLPTVAVTLGYKEVKQDFSGTAQFKYSGPTLGAVASAPLTGGFSLYGNFGYGPLKARLPVADASGNRRFDANYLLGEVGLAYALDLRDRMPSARALTLTAGYRHQVLATQDYRISTGANQSRATELRDTTEGLTVGLSVSF